METQLSHNPHYRRLGGEQAVRSLVDRFYAIMDRDPQAAKIRAMHSPDLAQAKQKLFMFLSGWMGGPPLYVEQYGHPRLRQRHLPFSIGEDERDAWMRCMQQAMIEQGIDDELREELTAAFYKTADFMRNQ